MVGPEIEAVAWASPMRSAVLHFVFAAYALGLLYLAWKVVRNLKDPTSLRSLLGSRRPANERGISLSKFQMLAWTLVLVFAWLYMFAQDPSQFPELPNQALLLMGISGATYLGSKKITGRYKKEFADDAKDVKLDDVPTPRKHGPTVPDDEAPGGTLDDEDRRRLAARRDGQT